MYLPSGAALAMLDAVMFTTQFPDASVNHVGYGQPRVSHDPCIPISGLLRILIQHPGRKPGLCRLCGRQRQRHTYQ